MRQSSMIGVNARRVTKCQVEARERGQEFSAHGDWHLLSCPAWLCLCLGALPKTREVLMQVIQQ